jgi:hypothetical protein
MKNSRSKLNIGWFYPDLMSTYGDRGNIMILTKRSLWRGIDVDLVLINLETNPKKIRALDLIFMGGAQDRQQEIVNEDLINNKASYLKEAIEKNIPALFICGAYQFMGKYYKAANGNIVTGLGIFDLYTEHPGLNKKRLIGDIIVKPFGDFNKMPWIGFENHGGRTYLSENIKPLAKVLKGFGNNGKDEEEGVIYNNAIGTYLHGPVLSKNPELADWLITKALEKKFDCIAELTKLDDKLEKKARAVIIKRYGL